MAQADYFLKIEGIDGEAQAKGHEKEIELISWSLGVTNASHGGGGGMGSGKAHFGDMLFAKKVDSSTPKLLLGCASGEHFKKGVLTCCKQGKDAQEFYKINLTEVLVSSYHLAGGSHGEGIVPTEQFSLSFSKLEVEYKPQKEDGTLGSAVKAGWDLKKNQKV